MDLLSEALRLAGVGLRVVPLHHLNDDGSCSCRKATCKAKHRGKHPRCGNDWPRKATNDPAQISKWWQTWPQANVGVATGKGIVVVDVDGETGDKSLIVWQREHGKLPDTGPGPHRVRRPPLLLSGSGGPAHPQLCGYSCSRHRHQGRQR